MSLDKKRLSLESRIAKLGSALIAFSGGVDSTVVLAVAHKVLGNRVLAVTAESESVPARELEVAHQLTRVLGIQHLVIPTEETSLPEYLKNPENRCYYCKTELYNKLSQIAAEHNLAYVLNGINRDDLGDHRPGITAAREAGVLSPLSDTGLTKQDVRDLAREMNLPNWKKPALACLSSRVPYGQPITMEKLSMIERAENLLLDAGFQQVRVRHHGDTARIELPREDIPVLFRNGLAEKISHRLREIGFSYITVDIEGYRSGSLNEILAPGNQAEFKNGKGSSADVGS
jgi:uncharacterized protein